MRPWPRAVESGDRQFRPPPEPNASSNATDIRDRPLSRSLLVPSKVTYSKGSSRTATPMADSTGQNQSSGNRRGRHEVPSSLPHHRPDQDRNRCDGGWNDPRSKGWTLTN